MELRWIILLTALVALLAPLAAAPQQIGAGHFKAGSDPYMLRIAAYYQDNGRTAVILNNGSVWRLQAPVLWLVGDSVYLTSLPQKQWNLYNVNDHSYAKVQFIRFTARSTQRIQELTNGGGKITLDDGSVWQVDWWQRIWGHVWSWRIGDHILIAPLQLLLRGHTHLLINTDRSWYNLEANLIL